MCFTSNQGQPVKWQSTTVEMLIPAPVNTFICSSLGCGLAVYHTTFSYMHQHLIGKVPWIIESTHFMVASRNKLINMGIVTL
jgi:hypothetical protein